MEKDTTTTYLLKCLYAAEITRKADELQKQHKGLNEDDAITEAIRELHHDQMMLFGRLCSSYPNAFQWREATP